MNKMQQKYDGPVPLENHYELFKEIEKRLTEQLERQEQEYLLIGLRVAYDVLESSVEEPGIFPSTVEFGYLEEVDNALHCAKNVSEEDLNEAARHSPIPITLLDEIYEHAKKMLESWAGTALAVGVFLSIKTPMMILSEGVACYCKGQKGMKAYYVRGKKYCKRGC